ncbi:MAG TPA: PAS domain S-box protein [Rhodocyclaceae bacterium]
MTESRLPRLLAANLGAAAAALAAGAACLAWQPPGAPLPALWLPWGVAGAILFLGGRARLPGIWLGQAAALALLPGLPWYGAAVAGLGEAATAWLAARLLRRLAPRGPSRDAGPWRFLLVAYGCAALAGLLAPVVLRLFGVIAGSSLDGAAIAWWLADSLGMVVFLPAALEARHAWSGRRLVPPCSFAMAGLGVAAAVFGLLIFIAGPLPANPYLQAALLLPALLALTVRCHPAVPLGLNLILAMALASGAAGSFGEALGATAAARAHALHGFAVLGSTIVLFLAAHLHGLRRAADAARAGEERFRRLSALTSDWYWEQDADFRFTRIEGTALADADELQWRFIGKRHDELPGFEPYNAGWEPHEADLLARRTFHGRMLRYARPDGRVSYYSTSGEPVWDAEGVFCGYRGVGRDVTPEIESREALLASERQFHEVADATFEGLLVHDYGRIVFANRACAEIAGRGIEALVGRTLLDFVAPEEHAAVIHRLANSDQLKNFETVAINGEGRRVPIEIFARPFVFQGQPMRLVAIRDVSDRRQTEGALRAQIEFQRTLLDTIPNGVFYRDRQGRFLGYNRAFAELMGIAAGEYIGRTMLDLVPGELARRFGAGDEALLASPGTQSHEEAIETPRGRRDMVVYQDVFRDDKGAIAGFVGILADITERKKSEQRLRRFQELSPAAIGIVSTGGQVLYINPAAAHLFGFRIEDVPNMEAWWQLAYPDPAYRADRYAAWLAAVEQTLREGRYMFRFDGRVRCMDGKDRFIETMVSLGEDEIFMIFTDLTDYVEAVPAVG